LCELEKNIEKLKEEKDKLIKCGKELIETVELTHFSMFASGILHRTVNLNRGFINLIEDSNFLTAAPLVRLNLDSLLIIFGSTQSTFDMNTYAQKVINGERINSMKDSKGKNLRESYLVKKLSKIQGFKWTKDIYNIGSSFVHFSHNHIINSNKVNGQTIEGGIRIDDKYVEHSEKIASTQYMYLCSKGIRIFIGDIIDMLNEN